MVVAQVPVELGLTRELQLALRALEDGHEASVRRAGAPVPGCASAAEQLPSVIIPAMQSTEDGSVFRWKSLHGAATALFLLYGAVNVLFAVYVPLSLLGKGAGGLGSGGVVFSKAGDEHLLGRTLASLKPNEPGLNGLLVSSMVGMCAMMMSFGIAYLAIAWLAMRRGSRWAEWTLAVSGVASVPYYVVIAADYSRHRASTSEGLMPLIPFWLIPLIALVLTLVASRPTRAAAT